MNCVYRTVPASSGSVSAPYGTTTLFVPVIVGDLVYTGTPIEIYPLVETCNIISSYSTLAREYILCKLTLDVNVSEDKQCTHIHAYIKYY